MSNKRKAARTQGLFTVCAAPLLLSIGITGCFSSGDSSDDTTDVEEPKSELKALADSIHSVNMQGAEGFALKSQEDVTQSQNISTLNDSNDTNSQFENSNTLFKITEEGVFEPVIVENKSGENLTDEGVTPLRVDQVSDDFVLMSFRIPGLAGQRGIRFFERSDGKRVHPQEVVVSLVHKQSGRAFDVTSAQFPGWVSPSERELTVFRGYEEGSVNALELDPNRPPYFTPAVIDGQDDQGNLYIYAQISGLNNHKDSDLDLSVKLLVVNTDGLLSGDPLVVNSLPTGPDAIHRRKPLIPADNGDFVLYSGFRLDGGGNISNWIDIKSGTLNRLNATPDISLNEISKGDQVAAFAYDDARLALNGDAFVQIDGGPNSFAPHYIFQVANIEGTPRFVFVGELETKRVPEGGNSYCDGSLTPEGSLSYEPVTVGGMVFRGMVEVDDPNALHTKHCPWDSDDVEQLALSSNFFWARLVTEKGDKISRYDPVSKHTELVTLDDDIQISRMELLSRDTVLIEGFNFASQAQFRGELDIAGNLKVNERFNEFESSEIKIYPIDNSIFSFVVDGKSDNWENSDRLFYDQSDVLEALHQYSERQANGRYFGIVEFSNDALPAEGKTTVELNQTHEIIFDFENEKANPSIGIKGDESTQESLFSIGGVAQVEEAIEFSVPVSYFKGGTPQGSTIRHQRNEGSEGSEVNDIMED